MSCKHPLKAFQIGLTENGKPKYKITSYDVMTVCHENGKNISTHDYVMQRFPNERFSTVTDFIEIPCGHCIECRLKYSRDWANRMMLEAQEHSENWFITLTYNNDNLPEPNQCVIDEETAEIGDSPIHPLVLRDLQLFLKRLRRQQKDNKIRFYACGEYGSINMRPHYHLIVFGLHLDDLIEHSWNELGQCVYRSKTIEDLWYNEETHESLGFSTVAEVSWESCAYVARYVTKKLSGEQSEIYERWNFPKEFCTMSRRPGIARNYYDNHKLDIYETDELIMNLGSRGCKVSKPPRYFDSLFDIDYPDECATMKEQRRAIAESNAKVKENLTSLSYLQQLAVEEYNTKERIKIHRRRDL